MFSLLVTVFAAGFGLGGVQSDTTHPRFSLHELHAQHRGPETPPAMKKLEAQLAAKFGGMREAPERPRPFSAASSSTASPTTASATTAAATTAAATTATATTSAAGGAVCSDDDRQLSVWSDGQLDSCATYADAGTTCVDPDFAAICCAACGGQGACSDRDDVLKQASEGRFETCSTYVDYAGAGICSDSDVQEICCGTCSSSGGSSWGTTSSTTTRMAAAGAVKDPALAAVQAAQGVADERKLEAQLAVAGAEAAQETAAAARDAAARAMNAQVAAANQAPGAAPEPGTANEAYVPQ